MTDLPPLDDDIAYVVVAENDQRGPYQLEVLITEVLAGRIYDSTPIWWPGLPEWTTIAAHPGIAAELQRRRDAYAAASGAAVPQPSPMGPPPAGPSPAPTLGMFGQSVAGAAAPADQTQAPVYSNPGQDYSTDLYAGSGVAAPVSPVLEPQPGAAVPADPQFQQVPPGQQVPAQVAGGLAPDVPAANPFAPGGNAPSAGAPAAVPAVAPVQAPALDPVAARNYSSLVDRSRLRSEHRARIESVDEQFVAAVQTAAAGLGLRSAGRTDSDQHHELRFDGPSGDLLVMSLGRVVATAPADLTVAHVPTTLTYRAAATATVQDPGTGAHGEVRVAADQWTGQATSSVSLVLGLEDYLDATLSVDQAAVARDLAAAVGVLRDRAR